MRGNIDDTEADATDMGDEEGDFVGNDIGDMKGDTNDIGGTEGGITGTGQRGGVRCGRRRLVGG